MRRSRSNSCRTSPRDGLPAGLVSPCQGSQQHVLTLWPWPPSHGALLPLPSFLLPSRFQSICLFFSFLQTGKTKQEVHEHSLPGHLDLAGAQGHPRLAFVTPVPKDAQDPKPPVLSHRPSVECTRRRTVAAQGQTGLWLSPVWPMQCFFKNI